MDKTDLTEITLEYLQDTTAGENLDRIITAIEKIQGTLCRLAENEDSDNLKKLKIGTALLLSVVSKAKEGVFPKDFKKKDWEDIAGAVSSIAVHMDGRDYSVYVFRAYAAWIEQSANLLLGRISYQRTEAIRKLAQELKSRIEQFEKEEINEVSFIDDCLWISLEAAIKIFAAYLSPKGIPQISGLIDSAAMAAFEYSRLMLLKKEQLLLTEFIENQYALDEELQKKFEEFRIELKADADRFNDLIENAFEPGFRERLERSVKLAKEAGVKEEDILDTAEKIDSFFLG